MDSLTFKAYHYARLKIELALVMGWVDILDPTIDFDAMEKKFEKQYLEKHGEEDG